MPISLANIIDREQGATSQEHKTQNDTEFSKMDHKKKDGKFRGAWDMDKTEIGLSIHKTIFKKL